jgi:CheY-like chemotaxis protein/CheY-specific phosphatase CheX
MIEGALETLIIDDSPADAQMLSYLLTKRLNCRVEVAEDGIQGLDSLSSRRFDLVFLDLVMPLMSGVEVLKEIRECPETADLPIVIISGIADPRTIATLLKLRLLDYIIKPYHAEIIVKRLSEKLAALKASRSLPLSMKPPHEEYVRDPYRDAILIVDGDANFRHFCSETLRDRFQIFEAMNGGQAIALAVKFAPECIIVGSRLGAFDRDRMVAKMRQIPGLGDVKILAVTTDGQSNTESLPLYDGFLRRTFVAEAFIASTKRWLSGSSALQLTADSFKHLREALLSATEQVFGMMMSAEIHVKETPAPLYSSSPLTYGVIRLASFDECRRLAISFYAEHDSVKAMSIRMLHMQEERSAEAVELAHSSLAEILNIIAGRIENSLDEEGRKFCIGFPTVEERVSAPNDDESNGDFAIHFTAGANIDFTIALSMDRLATSRIAAAALADAMVVADSIDLGGGARLAKGVKLNREHITAIEKAQVEEIEVFDPF